MDHYRELYTAYNLEDRMVVLRNTLDDDLIARAQKEMSHTYGAANEFYEIFQKIAPDAVEKNKELIDQIDFDYFGSPANYDLLIRIFRNINIDFDDYNDEDPESPIDLTEYYEQQYIKAISKYENNYRVSLSIWNT